MFDSLLLYIKEILTSLMVLAVIGFGVSLAVASFFSYTLARLGAVFCIVVLLFLFWLDGVITIPDKNIDTGRLNVYPFIKTQEHKYYEKQTVINILNINQPYSPGMELPIGTYDIEATLKGYETRQVTIKLSMDQTLNLYIRMRPVLDTERLDITATTKDFESRTRKALELLKATDNAAYNIATRHMDNIQQIPISGGTQGMLTRYYPYWETYPTFNVAESSWKNVSYRDNTIWYASVIAHDSYHAKLYDDAEILCLKNQEKLPDGSKIVQPNFVCSDPDIKSWSMKTAEMSANAYQISVLEKIPGAKNELLYLRLLQQICKGMHYILNHPCIKETSKQFSQQISK
ncbi:MAG TPA: carboxypeptidase regulatory-like domain-containing protein [Gammaproteobacteria bacterium]|nr:carboxypeptidase regulatory-like domain-containing protein [Gammaproteobacteria bacterium]